MIERNLSIDNKIKGKNWELGKFVKLTLGALATTFVLSQPVNADNLSSQDLVNLNKLLSHNNVSYTAKEVVNYNLGLLRKYLQIEDNKKLENINSDIIKLFTDSYTNKINGENLLFNFWELKDKYNLKDKELLKLFKYYLDNNLIPQNTRKSIENELNLTYTGLLSRYNRKELAIKLNQADKLFKTDKLNKETIKNIFPEYLTKIEKNQESSKILLLMFVIMLGTIGAGIYSEFEEGVLQGN